MNWAAQGPLGRLLQIVYVLVVVLSVTTRQEKKLAIQLLSRSWACEFERMDVELVLDCFNLTLTGVRLDEQQREFGRTRTTLSTCARCAFFVCSLFDLFVWDGRCFAIVRAYRFTVVSLALLHRSASRLTHVVQTEEARCEHLSQARVFVCEVSTHMLRWHFYKQMFCLQEETPEQMFCFYIFLWPTM